MRLWVDPATQSRLPSCEKFLQYSSQRCSWLLPHSLLPIAQVPAEGEAAGAAAAIAVEEVAEEAAAAIAVEEAVAGLMVAQVAPMVAAVDIMVEPPGHMVQSSAAGSMVARLGTMA